MPWDSFPKLLLKSILSQYLNQKLFASIFFSFSRRTQYRMSIIMISIIYSLGTLLWIPPIPDIYLILMPFSFSVLHSNYFLLIILFSGYILEILATQMKKNLKVTQGNSTQNVLLGPRCIGLKTSSKYFLLFLEGWALNKHSFGWLLKFIYWLWSIP